MYWYLSILRNAGLMSDECALNAELVSTHRLLKT